ncbi:MAG: hypothetical protein WD135_07775 [Ferruginibacter sp.]
MKKILYIGLFSTLLAVSCGKDKDTPPDPNGGSYMNAKAGSTWNYEVINNQPPVSTSNYTLTSTNRDSSVNGKTYHVYINSSNGRSEYYHVAGSDHFTFGSLPAAVGANFNVENLYLKSDAAPGATWSQPYTITLPGFPLPLSVTVTHKIEEKGLTKVVNSVTYNNVIHITTTLSGPGITPSILTTNINIFYAPNHGLIESNNIITSSLIGNSNSTTRLKTATLIP